MMTDTFDYDLLIIGGGAAGLTAAIYSVRYNLSTVVVSTEFGGQILETGDIENWPGNKRISGRDLSAAYEDHAKSLGANLVYGYVKSIEKLDNGFKVFVDGGEKPEFIVKTIILTTGAKHKKLGIEGEEKFAGRGISYCVTCDGPFFKNKTAVVVGGGDAAITGAIDLTVHAQKVYIVHRREEFKAKPAYVQVAQNNPKIEFILNANVVGVDGSGKLEKVILDTTYNGSNELLVDGLFVEIGFLPETSLVKSLGLEFDDQGYIKVLPDQSTNIPGLYAAGDVTNASNRFAQLVTAAAEGAIASESAFRRVSNM